MSGMIKMSMTFSQNGNMVDMYGMSVKNQRNIVVEDTPQPQPQQQQQPRAQINNQSREMVMSNRSTPKNIRQLFNMAHIMANPGTPCKACGS